MEAVLRKLSENQPCVYYSLRSLFVDQTPFINATSLYKVAYEMDLSVGLIYSTANFFFVKAYFQHGVGGSLGSKTFLLFIPRSHKIADRVSSHKQSLIEGAISRRTAITHEPLSQEGLGYLSRRGLVMYFIVFPRLSGGANKRSSWKVI